MLRHSFFIFIILYTHLVYSQIKDAPVIKEGMGPYSQLIIRGATLINGNGAPPIGPVDVVVENNKIVQVKTVGYPGVAIDQKRRPELIEGGFEINAEGMYLLPGLIDMHGHIGGSSQGTPAEYVFKLWMGHGITTIRDPSAGNGLEWVLKHKKLSEKNEITAPRIYAYTSFGQNLTKVATTRNLPGEKTKPISEKLSGEIITAEDAIKWVDANYRRGADGIKFFGASPIVMEAALKRNKELGLRSACHHAQMDVAWWNVVNSAEAGLTSMEHWYGLPEALFTDRTVQNYPLDYNYQNEQHRFSEAGRLWSQAAEPYSEKWNSVMNKLISLDFTLDPTFNIYEANRDLMRAITAEWHDLYTLPSLWSFYAPSRISHGSYWHNWGTEEEVAWKRNYTLWMTFVNEYKNRGGRVTAGSDSGFIYQLYGFGYIRELELLREAGFHPLEVIRSATYFGAQALGISEQLGTIEPGKLADMILVKENPLENIKNLYGTGTIKLNDANEVIRAGGVIYTIKDGVVYDAKKLLEDVRKMVVQAKNNIELSNPGLKNE